jgi:phosphohistidine phosphatase
MKTLYVLRHGQAGPESEVMSDHERSLTPRGRNEARLAAEHLAGRPRLPTLIFSSSALRARETAEVSLVALPEHTRLTIVSELYLAEPPTYLAVLGVASDPHDAVLVVGHNPGLEGLVYLLTSRSEHLATASLFEIELPIASWGELSASASVSGLVGKIVDHFRVR